jgi:hypothetical protein
MSDDEYGGGGGGDYDYDGGGYIFLFSFYCSIPLLLTIAMILFLKNFLKLHRFNEDTFVRIIIVHLIPPPRILKEKNQRTITTIS